MSPMGAASLCPRLSVIIVIIVIVVQPTVDSVKYSSKYKHGDFVEKPKYSKNNFLLDSSDSHKNLVNLTADPDQVLNESIEKYWPMKVFDCVESSGIEKCLKIFLIKRMKRIVNQVNNNKKSDVNINFDVVSEIKNDFNWEEYNNTNDKELDNSIFSNINKVFKNKNTNLVLYPGIDVNVAPDKNGTMQLNIKKNAELELPRGMKMQKKMFYRLIPMLLIPPLIMSAILPFVLPAMKIMILWVGLINQMALGGAIFTLMRNNAFQEPMHTKKVIYVNDGYKNDKKPSPIHHNNHQRPIFDKQPQYHHEQQSHSSFHPPVNHFKGFPHVTTGGYEEDFDDGGGVGDFSEGGPSHFSQGHYGNVQHHFNDDEFDRTSHHFNNGFNNAFKKKEKHHIG